MFILKIKKSFLSRFEARLARANHVPRDLQEPITYHETCKSQSRTTRLARANHLPREISKEVKKLKKALIKVSYPYNIY